MLPLDLPDLPWQHVGAVGTIGPGSGLGVQFRRGLVWATVTFAGKAKCRVVMLLDGSGGHLGVRGSSELVLAQAGLHQLVHHSIVRLGNFVHEINDLLVN